MERSDVIWALSQAFINNTYPMTKGKVYSWIRYEGSKKELDRYLKDLVKGGLFVKMGKHYEPTPRTKGIIAAGHAEFGESMCDWR